METNKILIIGHGGHGKDTVAGMLKAYAPSLTFSSSSMKAAELFIYDQLKEKYGYMSFEECYNDRHNRRKEWHDLIVEYNKEDPAKLAKAILEDNDIYVGMRSNREFEECANQRLFTLVIGVYDPRKPEESKDSFNIDFWKVCDIVIPNGGTLPELATKVATISYMLKKTQVI